MNKDAKPKFFMSLLSNFWNSKISASSASLIRILVYGYVFYCFSSATNIDYSRLPKLFWQPSGLGHFLNFFAPPLPAFGLLHQIWLLSLLCSCIGFLTRTNKILSFLGFVALGTYDQHFGWVSFHWIPMTFALFYLLFLEDGMISLDRFIFPKSRLNLKQPLRVDAWPVLCFQSFHIFLYVASAVQKLHLSGWNWFFGGTFKAFFIPFVPESIFHQVGLWSSIAVFLIEITSPLLFTRKWGLLYVGLFASFHFLSAYFFYVQTGPWTVLLLTFLFSRTRFSRFDTDFGGRQPNGSNP